MARLERLGEVPGGGTAYRVQEDEPQGQEWREQEHYRKVGRGSKRCGSCNAFLDNAGSNVPRKGRCSRFGGDAVREDYVCDKWQAL